MNLLPRALGVIIVLMAGLVSPRCALGSRETVDVLDIQEAILRWAIANADTNLQPPAAYCLGYTEDMDTVDRTLMKDPSHMLMQRLQDLAAPVRPVSECQIVGGGEHGVVDRVTNGYGLLIGFGPPRTERDRITVPVGYIQGGDVGLGWNCVVRQASSSWVVESCEVVFHI